jgi:hypothetical protein
MKLKRQIVAPAKIPKACRFESHGTDVRVGRHLGIIAGVRVRTEGDF